MQMLMVYQHCPSEKVQDPVSVFQCSYVYDLPVTASKVAVKTSRDVTLATVYRYICHGRVA